MLTQHSYLPCLRRRHGRHYPPQCEYALILLVGIINYHLLLLIFITWRLQLTTITLSVMLIRFRGTMFDYGLQFGIGLFLKTGFLTIGKKARMQETRFIHLFFIL